MKLHYDTHPGQLDLKIKVTEESTKPVTDLKVLSGGERSFITVCFMLALARVISSPFHCMDEFDVFMDAIYRRVSLRHTQTLCRSYILVAILVCMVTCACPVQSFSFTVQITFKLLQHSVPPWLRQANCPCNCCSPNCSVVTTSRHVNQLLILSYNHTTFVLNSHGYVPRCL